MRKKAEVVEAEQAACDLLWYVRHRNWEMPQGTPQDIIDKAEEAAKKIEATADPEYLANLRSQDLEYGMLVGRLTALRWMLGTEWDEEGILDT